MAGKYYKQENFKDNAIIEPEYFTGAFDEIEEDYSKVTTEINNVKSSYARKSEISAEYFSQADSKNLFATKEQVGTVYSPVRITYKREKEFKGSNANPDSYTIYSLTGGSTKTFALDEYYSRLTKEFFYSTSGYCTDTKKYNNNPDSEKDKDDIDKNIIGSYKEFDGFIIIQNNTGANDKTLIPTLTLPTFTELIDLEISYIKASQSDLNSENIDAILKLNQTIVKPTKTNTNDDTVILPAITKIDKGYYVVICVSAKFIDNTQLEDVQGSTT